MHKPVKRIKTSHHIIKHVVKPFQSKERNTHFLVLIVIILLALLYISTFQTSEIQNAKKDISGKGYLGALQCAQVVCDYIVTDMSNKEQLVSLSEGSTTQLTTVDYSLDVTLLGKGDIPDSCKTHFKWCNLNEGTCREEDKNMVNGQTAVYSYNMLVTLDKGFCFEPIIPLCLNDNDCTDGKVCNVQTGACYYQDAAPEIEAYVTYTILEGETPYYQPTLQFTFKDADYPMKYELYGPNNEFKGNKQFNSLSPTTSPGIEAYSSVTLEYPLTFADGWGQFCQFSRCGSDQYLLKLYDYKDHIYEIKLNKENNYYYNHDVSKNAYSSEKNNLCLCNEAKNNEENDEKTQTILCSDSDSTEQNGQLPSGVIPSLQETNYLNYNTKGTVSYRTGTYVDSCITEGKTTLLVEHFCDLKSNTPGRVKVECPEGTRCDKTKGACVTTLHLTPDAEKKEPVNLCKALSISCPAGSSCFLGNCYQTDSKGNIGDGSCLEKCHSTAVCLRQICSGMNTLPQDIDTFLEKSKVDPCKGITCQANEACFKGICVVKDTQGNIGDGSCKATCGQGLVCSEQACKNPDDPTVNPLDVVDTVDVTPDSDDQKEDDHDTGEKDLCALLPKSCPSGSTCLQGNCYTVDDKDNMGDGSCTVTCDTGLICTNKKCQDPDDLPIDIKDILKGSKVDLCKDIKCQDNQACLKGVCLNKNQDGSLGDGSCAKACPVDSICLTKECVLNDDIAISALNISQNQSQQKTTQQDQQDSGDSKKGSKKLYSKLYKGNIFDKDISSSSSKSSSISFSITKIEKKKQKKPQTIKIGTVKSPVKQDIKPQVKQSVQTLKTQEKVFEPSCSDSIKNQDETDIDCGGSCIACKEKGKLLRWWAWALLAVGLFGILVLIGEAKIYRLFSRPKASSSFSSKQAPLTTIAPKKEGALAFMKEQLNKGISKDEIIDNMLAAGWEDEFVTKLFDEHFAELVSQRDKEQVAKFIAYYRKKGMSEEDIKETLKDSGWDEGLLDTLLKKQ